MEPAGCDAEGLINNVSVQDGSYGTEKLIAIPTKSCGAEGLIDNVIVQDGSYGTKNLIAIPPKAVVPKS